ncbi:MAG: NosD domain-containing protein [Thermoplasmatota archaeon]
MEKNSSQFTKGSPGPIIAYYLELWAQKIDSYYIQSRETWDLEILQHRLDIENTVNQTVIVDDEGDGDFTSIQQAINSVPSSSAILIYSGSYETPLVIDKPVWLIGISEEYKNGTDFGKPLLMNTPPFSEESTIEINAHNTTISGLNIESDYTAIQANYSDNLIIFENTIRVSKRGSAIYCKNCSGQIKENMVFGSNISKNGLCLFSSSDLLAKANIFNHFQNALTVSNCNNVSIMSNTFSNSSDNGIFFSDGIINDTSFAKNNFINNNVHVAANSNVMFINNSWTLNSVGNYWDTYEGVDVDKNGIGDDPYNIGDHIGLDFFPLIHEVKNHPPNVPIINVDETGILCGKTKENIPFFVTIDDEDGNNVSCKWLWGENHDSWDGPYRVPKTLSESNVWESNGKHIVSVYYIHALLKDDEGLTVSSEPYEIHIYDLSAIPNPFFRSIVDTFIPSYFLTGWN